MRSLLISLVLALLFDRSATADIVGGEVVQEGDPVRSSTAGLYTPSPDGKGGSLCTATLIGKDIAVTAAHCVQSGGPNPVILFGRDLHAPGTVKRQVTGVKISPRWAKSRGRGMDEGDIALVHFPGGIPSGFHTVRTATSDATVARGKEAVLAGYGISNARRRTGSGILRKARVRIVDPRPGKTEMILDQSHGKGACHGDSGGPAFVTEGGRTVLAGVTNRSYPAGAPDDCAHKVVYTKVSAYRKWIRDGKKELHSAPQTRLMRRRISYRLGKSTKRVARRHARAHR